jgi:hypothetical protein
VNYALEANDGKETTRHSGRGDGDEDDDAEHRAGALPAGAAQKEVRGRRGHGGRGGGRRGRGTIVGWEMERELLAVLSWPRSATIASNV